MHEKSETSLVAARGNWGFVLYAPRADGSVPARDFYQSCQRQDQAKLNTLFQYLAEMGWLSHPQKCKVLEGELCELKSHQHRVSCYRVGRCWYLLHGFVKKQDHWPRGELQHAQNLLSDHKALLASQKQQRKP